MTIDTHDASSRRARLDVEDRRDIAVHLVNMRNAVLYGADAGFHGSLDGQIKGAWLFACEAQHISEHLGLEPRAVVSLFADRYVKAQTTRRIERCGPCPQIAQHAAEGMADIERIANGEEPIR